MKKFTYTLAALLASITLANAQARLQVIHNCADPAAARVDIYLNNGATPLLNDFEFRTASPFIDAPAGVPLTISVSGPASTSAANPIKTFTVTLEDKKTYVAVASGVVGAAFAANPDKISTAFDLVISATGAEKVVGTPAGKSVSFAVMHGATDAPFVDVEALGVGTLVNNAPYKGFTTYLTVPATEYIINIKDSTGKVLVASYKADLTALDKAAAVVFASGFLDPTKNSSGKPFGLFAALPNGTVVEFPKSDKAILQIIHNAPQLAAGNVDIYVNRALLLDNFMYRKATKFVEVPAGVVLNVAVAPSTSTSFVQALATFPVTLTAGKAYVAIASGLLGGDATTAFTLLTKEDVMYEGIAGKNVLYVVHGSPDAPTVDVVARGVATLVDDAAYKAIAGPLEVPANDYTIDIKNAAATVTVASFSAPIKGLAGKTAIVLASGFLAPTGSETNAFGLIAVLANGDVIVLPSAPTSTDAAAAFSSFNIFPVPASDMMYVNLNSDFSSDATFQMTDMAGRVVNAGKVNLTNGSNKLEFNVSNLEVGSYLLKLASAKNVSNVKFMVSK